MCRAHQYLNSRTVKGNNCYCHYDGRGEFQIWCKTKTGGIAHSTSTRKRVARLIRLKEDRRSGPHDRATDGGDLNFRSQRSGLIGRRRMMVGSAPLHIGVTFLRTSRSFTQIRFALRPLLTNDRRKGRATARFGRRANLELQARGQAFSCGRLPRCSLI